MYSGHYFHWFCVGFLALTCRIDWIKHRPVSTMPPKYELKEAQAAEAASIMTNAKQDQAISQNGVRYAGFTEMAFLFPNSG
ncbi:MAG TPA: hypothetical protein ACFCUC_05830 [Desulfobacterales bacterium]